MGWVGINLCGQKFGRLSVGPRGPNKGHLWSWVCKCDCGNFTTVSGSNLRSGGVLSCGCLQRERTRQRCSLPYGIASFNGVFRSTKQSAKKRHIKWRITKEEFQILTLLPCHYCWQAPRPVQIVQTPNGPCTVSGLDRVDNLKPYVLENVVSCCPDCNFAKRTRSTDEFFIWIKRVYNHNFPPESALIQ